MRGKYDDIINLPHHVSATHPHMPISDRAAQFSPFAALTGYDAEIREAARLTADRVELNEDIQDLLEEKLRLLVDAISSCPTVTITYFLPDNKKVGGAYVTCSGTVKKFDDFERTIIMSDGKRISIQDVLDIEWEYGQTK